MTSPQVKVAIVYINTEREIYQSSKFFLAPIIFSSFDDVVVELSCISKPEAIRISRSY